MENENQTPVIPPPTQPPSAAKKWYRHKGIVWIIGLAIIAALAVCLYYVKRPVQKANPEIIQNDNQNRSYVISIPSSATSTMEQINTSDWKTYTNSQYGFSFKYPADLTDSGGHIEEGDSFASSSDGYLVFQLDIFQTNQTLADYADSQINPNPPTIPIDCNNTSHLIKEPDTGVLYDISCSSGYDRYYYIFKNQVGQVIQLQYSDAFPQNEPEEQKVSVLENIIAGLKVFPPVAPNIVVSNSLGQWIIQDKYSLFAQAWALQPDGYTSISATQYQDDGIITSGQYAGYHRLAGLENEDDPGGGATYFFATKDYKTFILDSGTYPTYLNPAAALADSNTVFNKEKVVGVGNISSNFPVTIDQGDFIMLRNQADWNPFVSGTPELTSNSAGLNFFAPPVKISSVNGSGNEEDGYQTLITTEQKYVAANTYILVRDQQGLVYDYTFLSKEEYNRNYASSTSTPSYAFNFYKQNELNSVSPLYQEYGQLFPVSCGRADVTDVLQNISASDLIQVAITVNGVQLYTLKDPNHPLNKAAYYAKITDWKDEFGEINNNQPIPSYQTYIASNPVLIFQDPWGRWVGLGEWQYQTGGGCGKPVVYLYPTKPTEVTVKFQNPMHFSVDIPAYVGEWDVLANPNGELKDLQPQYTDCGKINYNLPGSEYAQDACKQGMYPYLYWAGQTSNTYPTASQGWIVNKNNLSDFLNSKLTEVGLNEKEKSDMLSYWVPQLLSKNAPYYRLSFFQTQTMDNFIPMQITPKPDTLFRIFLDWSPLSNAPTMPLQPEALNHLNRNGFTVVEWGGLKQ